MVIEMLAMLRWLTSRKKAWFGFNCILRLKNRRKKDCDSDHRQNFRASFRVPENLDELGHGDVIGDEELGLVEQRQVLLSGKAFDDDGDFVGVQLPDQVGILNALL